MTLLYFAPVPWDSYQQRSHYVVQHFLKGDGHTVVWIDPYPTRLPQVSDFRRIRLRSRMAVARPSTLRVVSPWALPLEPLAAGRWFNRRFVWGALRRHLQPLLHGEVGLGIGRPSGLALAALCDLQPDWSFYDAMDDFPEFYSGVSKQSVQDYETQIARAVDVVATASSSLWRKFESAGARRRSVPNAFAMATLPPPSIDRQRQRVFGYIGCVGAWFDWALLIELADAVPDAGIHVVGPLFSPPPRRLPPNVQLFPACTAERAIEYLEGFSVGLIPFKRTPLTDAVDPVKYYGYRGMGLPVLSSSFGEMAGRGFDERTFLVDQGDALADTAVATLGAGADASAADVLAFRQQHTWERRLDESALFERRAS